MVGGPGIVLKYDEHTDFVDHKIKILNMGVPLGKICTVFKSFFFVSSQNWLLVKRVILGSMWNCNLIYREKYLHKIHGVIIGLDAR